MKQKNIRYLQQELENFENVSRILNTPAGDIPRLENIDIFGESIPLHGLVGGDHVIFVDFKKRFDLDSRIRMAEDRGTDEIEKNLIHNKSRAGILIADAAGHSITDAYLTGRLHDAFLTGALYELDTYGEITTRLFETLNTRFYSSLTIEKYLTLIYGEISENGRFRFILAGHPSPVVFSNRYDKITEISQERLITFPPLGTVPSEEDPDKKHHYSYLGYKKKYSVNEINLMGSGDIILLYTDGLSEHRQKGKYYFHTRLEGTLKSTKQLSAREIFSHLKEDILAFGPPRDDISFVVIKKKNGQ